MTSKLDREARSANLLLVILFSLYTLSFLDRQVIALMVEPIKQDLQISDFEFSLVQGLAFSIFYTLFGVPLGWAADHFDRRKIIFGGTVIWGSMTMACGLAGTFIQLFLARVGVGVGEASLSPAAYSLIGDKVPEAQQARAMSVYASASIFGAGVALLAGGILLAAIESADSLHFPLLGELKSWQVVFLICGLPGIFIALLLLLFKEPPRKGRSEQATKGFGPTLDYMRKHWRLFLFHFAGFSCFSIIGFGYAAWGPAFLMRCHGLTAEESGLLLGSLLIVFGPASAFLVGKLIRSMEAKGRADAPLRIYIVIGMISGPLAIVAYLTPQLWLCVAMLGLLIFIVSVFSGPATLAIKQVTPNEMRGQVTAMFILTISLVGLGVGPTLVASLTDFVFVDVAAVDKSLAIVSACAAVVAVIFLRLAKKPYARAVPAPGSQTAELQINQFPGVTRS